jgi:hypothetical protein
VGRVDGGIGVLDLPLKVEIQAAAPWDERKDGTEEIFVPAEALKSFLDVRPVLWGWSSNVKAQRQQLRSTSGKVSWKSLEEVGVARGDVYR